MTMNEVHFSSKTVEWHTPPEFFKNLDEEFKFNLDPSATIENTKCEKFFTKQDDGLKQSWEGYRVFCNPPYGYGIGEWIKKMHEGGAEICVGLLPARTDTRWFHDHVLGKSEIRFIKGRLKFSGHKWNAPFPNMVVIWRK